MSDMLVKLYSLPPLAPALAALAKANIEIQKQCPLDFTEHLGITYSQNSAQLVLKALDPSVTRNVCVLTLPYIGG